MPKSNDKRVTYKAWQVYSKDGDYCLIVFARKQGQAKMAIYGYEDRVDCPFVDIVALRLRELDRFSPDRLHVWDGSDNTKEELDAIRALGIWNENDSEGEDDWC